MVNNTSEKNQSTKSTSIQNIKKKVRRFISLRTICLILAVAIFATGAWYLVDTIRRGGETAKNAYEKAKKEAEEEVYQGFYDTAYASAERKYHVSNRVSIEVEAVKEEAKLEVLKVSDVEYVVKTKDDNDENIDAWVEFYGEGVYTVDMRACEFIIDEYRQYVLVRAPKPVLTNCRITKTNEILWKNDFFNESISEGVEVAIDMRKAGQTKLSNYMKSNARFFDSAKKSATAIISDLVKSLNSDLPDLTVDVELVDI